MRAAFSVDTRLTAAEFQQLHNFLDFWLALFAIIHTGPRHRKNTLRFVENLDVRKNGSLRANFVAILMIGLFGKRGRGFQKYASQRDRYTRNRNHADLRGYVIDLP